MDWSLPTDLYVDANPNAIISHAYLHPEMFQEGGKMMYLTFSRSGQPTPSLLRIELRPEQ
jgi:hypothetical protein